DAVRRTRVVQRLAARWRARTQASLGYAREATRLRHWLRESVKIKTLAHKVFYALRVYIGRVTLVQSLWRQRVATARVWRLHLDAQWTAFVATETSSEKVRKPRRLGYPYPAIDPSIRAHVLDETLAAHVGQAKMRFRALEADLLPHLIQSLQGLDGTKSRSQVRALAAGFALLGRVGHALRGIPGALDAATEAAIASVDFGVRHIPLLPLVTAAYKLQNPSFFHEPVKSLDEEGEAASAAAAPPHRTSLVPASRRKK
ncbi:hypothetical protein As57867_007547, partial [Aphanomyces stellatus]